MAQFLSVDIDYWAALPFSIAEQEMNTFFNNVRRLKVPIYVVKDHEELLPFIDRFTWSTLLNVDYHSDITSFVDTDASGILEVYKQPNGRLKFCHEAVLNCGTWVNFVKLRSTGYFKWLYPTEDSFCPDIATGGRCEEISDFWDKPQHSCHSWNSISAVKDWKRKIKWSQVCAVGISLSEEWLTHDVLTHFMGISFPKLVKCGAMSSMPLAMYLGKTGLLERSMTEAKDRAF